MTRSDTSCDTGSDTSSDTTWTASDEQFFRATEGLFTTEFLYGAGTLLASYDDETEPYDRNTTPAPAPATMPTATTQGGVTRTPLGG